MFASSHLKWFRLQFVRDTNVRRKAVEELTDKTLLAKIARTDRGDEEEDVGGSAVRKLTDQALLAGIAKTAGDVFVGLSAVWNEYLTDHSLLADIAKTASDASVRAGAVANLTDQTLLARFATTDADADVRRSAVDKLTDKALLAKISKTDGDAGVREAVIQRDAPIPADLKWRSGGCWSYQPDAFRAFDKIKTVILAFKRKNESARRSEVEVSVWHASRKVQYNHQLLVTSSRYAPARIEIGVVKGRRQVISRNSPDEELMNEVGMSLFESDSYDRCTPDSYEEYVRLGEAEIIRYARI